MPRYYRASPNTVVAYTDWKEAVEVVRREQGGTVNEYEQLGAEPAWNDAIVSTWHFKDGEWARQVFGTDGLPHAQPTRIDLMDDDAPDYRDEIAFKALEVLLSRVDLANTTADMLAQRSYEIADAMMKVREQ